MSDKSVTQRQRSSRYDIGSVARRRLIYPQNTEHVEALVRVPSENKGTKTPSQPAHINYDSQKADTLNVSQTSTTLSAGSLQSRQWAENWVRSSFQPATESFSATCDVYQLYQSAATAAGEKVLPVRGDKCFGKALKNAFQVSDRLSEASDDDDDHPPFKSSRLSHNCSTTTTARRWDSQLSAKMQKRTFPSATATRADLVVIPSDPKEQRAWFEAKKARQHCTGCGYFGTEAACAAHRKFDVRCGKGKFCPRCADIFIGPDAKRQLQIHLQTCDSVEYLPIKHILPRKQTKSPAYAKSEDEDDAVNERNYISQLKSFYGADISEDFVLAKLQQLRGKVAQQDSRLSKASNNPLIFTRDFDTPPPTRLQKPQAPHQSPFKHDPHVIAPTAVTVRPNGRIAERLKAERNREIPLTAESLKSMPPAAGASQSALEWMAGAEYPQNLIKRDVSLNSNSVTHTKFKKLMQ